jgi:hypothetical protein
MKVTINVVVLHERNGDVEYGRRWGRPGDQQSHSAVKSNRVYPDASPPELTWTVVMSGITDIDEFLHETADIEVK